MTALRRSVLWVHRWAGLSFGLVIAMMAVTGAGMVFRPQLATTLDPTLLRVQPCSAPRPLDELVTNARAVHSTSPVNYIWVHSESDASTWVRFVDNDTVYLDPCTAAVLGEQYRYGGLFGRLEQLHRFKFMPHGSLVTGSSALSFVALTVIGGFIVWWPHTLRALKAALSFRSRLTGRAYRMHLHRALGVYASLILMISALTGLPDAFTWCHDALYRLTASPLPAPDPKSGAPDGTAALSMQACWQRAQAVIPRPLEALISYPRKPGNAVQIDLLERSAPHSEARTLLYLDAHSGEILSFRPYGSSSRGDKLLAWLLAVHKGETGGLVVQLLLLAGALSVPVLAYTGISSYLRRLRSA